MENQTVDAALKGPGKTPEEQSAEEVLKINKQRRRRRKAWMLAALHYIGRKSP